MNAALAASATAAARGKTPTPRPAPTAAATGRKVAAVAVLLVSSVRKTMPAVTVAITASAGQAPAPAITSPIHAASPLSWITDASDSPPPNRIRTPHGTRSTSSHSSSAGRRGASADRTNRASDPAIAIPASDSAGIQRSRSGRAIHAAAVTEATAATTRSSRRAVPSPARATRRASAAGTPPSTPRARSAQERGSATATSGSPTSIHSRKPSRMP